MGSWSERLYQQAYRYLPPIYSRDFAYANNAPVALRMARANVSDITAKTFAELLSGPTIDFYVGSERRHWSLHRNLLCHHSPYFESEFLANESPKSSKKSELELPDQDPVGFELLVKWLYQGTLDDTSDMTDEKKYDYSVACHKLYLLCNKFDLPILRNESIDRYRQGLLEAQLVPDAEEINEIYRSSPPGSPFRKLMAQIAARQIMDPDSEKNAESYRNCFNDNPDFAVDMVNAIKAGTGGLLFDDPTDGDDAAYHEDPTPRQNVKGKDDEDQNLQTQARSDSPMENEDVILGTQNETQDFPHHQTRLDETTDTESDDSMEPAEPLPRVLLQEKESNQTTSTETQKVPLERSQRSLSYVEALRRRKDRGQLDSRGLWDYWNNMAMGAN
ncbi:hypothetical protein E4T38_07964 [Aureobasidium subglaciale]|nr:hypothetical protein E4T38_07964 [Aureobasidium subglaciale]KAI5216437.1 hypothetical protein E4T40_07974 [Aureobasidium subglaciale]KAI5219605.1 hypothetical protein E4T41_07856 [Aureobasidium subglaciale]KAI5257677.1 hypothetical protein E4T46_07865 [Aureobasidium subglaciale]